jgi:DNA-binding NtrC family response regulator
MFNVIVAEDEENLRMLLCEALELQGYRVHAFENAVDTWKHICKTEEAIDLLITDVRMPGEIDGLDLAWLVRRRLPTLPIVLSTGGFDEIKASGHPYTEILAKPWTLDRLTATCERLLGCEQASDNRPTFSAYAGSVR